MLYAIRGRELSSCKVQRSLKFEKQKELCVPLAASLNHSISLCLICKTGRITRSVSKDIMKVQCDNACQLSHKC